MKCLFIICFSLLLFAGANAQKSSREEFNGPFASWANVKTRFHAKGDGKTDDTKALQTALDSLTTTIDVEFNREVATRYVVVYLPAGKYNISKTLTLAGKIGVSFIGEDPLNTTIRWIGGDNDTMFFSNRSSHLKVSRITWDANNKKNIQQVGMHWKDTQMPKFAPTSVELSDMIFTGNPAYGIATGTYGGSDGTGIMDAEFAIKRCKFVSCTGAGIQIKGFNALDNWVWDCDFSNCAVGIECSHGNYHVYRSSFLQSKIADLKNKDPLYTSVRGCVSRNAAIFSIDEGASCNAFKRVFQGNSIFDCKATPIQYHHLGKISLIDNYFINEGAPQQFSLDYSSWCNGNYDVLSLNNSYQEANTFNLRKDMPSRIFSLSDKKINPKAITKPVTTGFPGFVPLVNRKVFDIPESATSNEIQKIINTASFLKNRAIVHFPLGTFKIDKTMEVPAGSDIQIIGDGLIYASALIKKGADDAKFYFFKINGPSYITIKDIQIGHDAVTDHTNAFLFSGIDQQASEVRMDQLYTLSNKTLNINKLDYTYFEKNNSFFSNGNTVIGGEKVAAGTGTSKLYCFGGQSAVTNLQNNATMVAKDCWWEGKTSNDVKPFNLSGNGNYTLDGAMIAPPALDSSAVINVSNFKGNITLMNLYLYGAISVNAASPGLNILIWNVNMMNKLDPTGFTRQKSGYKLAMLGITSQCSKSKDPKCADENPRSVADETIGITDVNSFITALSRDNQRAMPRRYRNLPVGVSNVYISRVSTLSGNAGYTFNK
ncbi:MAG: glycosyl hydrolase family 28-related protein [Chitinophagaceae bacterium]